jgi:hypothetical protein
MGHIITTAREETLSRPPRTPVISWCDSKTQYLRRIETMADAKVLSNQKTILANQATIVKNQKAILSNQATIVKNQKTLLANQGAIQNNQAALTQILDNQKEILAAVRK